MIKTAIIDSREPASVIEELQGHLQCPAAIAQLQCGDIWLDCADNSRIVIERKTLPDLLASIRDGRLINQAGEMQALYPAWCYILTESFTSSGGYVIDNGNSTCWTSGSVVGALLTVQDLGVQVAFYEPGKYANEVVRIASRDRGDVCRMPPRKIAEQITKQEKILCGFPKIGPATAKTILALAGSLRKALDMLLQDEDQELVSRKILSQNELNAIRSI